MSSESAVERQGDRRKNLKVGHIKAPKLVGIESTFKKVEREVLRLKMVLQGTLHRSSSCIFDYLRDVITHIIHRTKSFCAPLYSLHARLYLLIWGDGATPAREGWFAQKVFTFTGFVCGKGGFYFLEKVKYSPLFQFNAGSYN